MAVMVIQSEISGYQAFCNKMDSMVDLEFYENFVECLGEVSEGDIIVTTFDGNDELEKSLKQFRKVNLDLKIIIFYMDTDDEIIHEHSASKLAADLYLTAHITESELADNLKELGVTPQYISEETKTLALGIVNEHIADKDISDSAKKVSDSLDKAFSLLFFKEYQKAEKKKLKQTKEKEATVEELTEFSISEVEMSDEIDLEISDDELEVGNSDESPSSESVDPGEISLDDEGGLEELEFGSTDEIESEEVNPGEIDLGGEEDLSLSESASEESPEELSFGSEDDDTGLDLSFGEDSIEDISRDGDETEDILVEESGEDLSFSIEDDATEANDEDVGLAVDEIQFGDDSDSQIMDLGDESLTSSESDETIAGVEGLDLSEEEYLDSEPSMTIASSDLLEPTGEFVLSEIEESAQDEASLTEFNMGSTDDLVSSGDDEADDDMLDDIKTKMMEIDKLLLSEDEDEPAADDMEISMEHEVPGEVILDQAVDEVTALREMIKEDEPATVKGDVTPKTYASSPEMIKEHINFKNGHEEELIRLGETINTLRLDREQLLNRIHELEEKQNSEKRDYISLKAQLDEKNIENTIIKKRYSQQIEDLHVKLELAQSKNDILREQNKQYQADFEKLHRENKSDVNKVRHRERELEERLELLRTDADVQIQNRDHKILELKRRIDTLEFDIENAQIKERKTIDDQQLLEDKMNKVIQTLRLAIGDLEDDGTLSVRDRLIKKNLDV